MQDKDLERPFDDREESLLDESNPIKSENFSVTHETRGGASFNYQCPQCGGKFRSWSHDNPAVATSPEDTGDKRCPFCHVKAGDFGDHSNLRKENERLRKELEEAERQIENLQEALEEIEAKFE